MGGSTPLWISVAFIGVLLGFGSVLVTLVRLRKRLKTFMSGKSGASLEATLEWLTQKAATLDERLTEHEDGLRYIDRRVERGIRGLSLIRYDAYVGAGGAQSFSIGLLDEKSDGVILSIVTSRTHTGVYAKRVVAGTAESSLTEEEARALEEAKKRLRIS